MKKCKIYRTYNNSGYNSEGFPGDYTAYFVEAYLTDNKLVLCPNTKHETKPQYFCWDGKAEPVEPTETTETLKLYTPYWGIGLTDNDGLDLISPFVVDGRWGYCNDDGIVIVKPKWDFCDMYWGGGLARVYIGEQFDPIDPAAENRNGLWGFLDEDGDLIAETVYQYLTRICIYCDLALAKKDGKWGAINSSGNVVIDFNWDGIWFDWNSEANDKGVFVMKEIEGRKQFSAISRYGKIMVEDVSDFTIPDFPKWFACDDEENY